MWRGRVVIKGDNKVGGKKGDGNVLEIMRRKWFIEYWVMKWFKCCLWVWGWEVIIVFGNLEVMGDVDRVI